MKSVFSGFVASSASPMAEVMSAYHATRRDIADQHLLAYTPVARMNPYQALIYKSFSDEGIMTVPLLQPGKFIDLQDLPLNPKTKSLHLHWNSWMTQGMQDEQRARMMGLGMAGRLKRLQKKGFNIIWTVHNVYPHDALHVDVELEIQQEIANSADILHVMSPSTIEAMSGITDIDPAKVLISPHPSYKGAYPDFISREEARSTFGIAGDEIVFVIFGALKAYKGLLRTLLAFDQLVAKNPLQRFRLLVAGKSDGSGEAEEFVRRCLVHPNVLIENSAIPFDKVQYFMRAGDVGLVHYARSLNSGAALLYGAFDLPIVASSTPTFRSELHLGSTCFVEGPEASDLAESMQQSAEMLEDDQIESSLREFQSNLSADSVSNAFAKELISRLK